MRCPSCDREVEIAAGARLGFRDACEGCGADLHCCRACAHYDPGAYNECREPRAERVLDKERANRCDEFAPGEGGAAGARGAAEAARTELDALFKKP